MCLLIGEIFFGLLLLLLPLLRWNGVSMLSCSVVQLHLSIFTVIFHAEWEFNLRLLNLKHLNEAITCAFALWNNGAGKRTNKNNIIQFFFPAHSSAHTVKFLFFFVQRKPFSFYHFLSVHFCERIIMIDCWAKLKKNGRKVFGARKIPAGWRCRQKRVKNHWGRLNRVEWQKIYRLLHCRWCMEN